MRGRESAAKWLAFISLAYCRNRVLSGFVNLPRTGSNASQTLSWTNTSKQLTKKRESRESNLGLGEGELLLDAHALLDLDLLALVV